MPTCTENSHKPSGRHELPSLELFQSISYCSQFSSNCLSLQFQLILDASFIAVLWAHFAHEHLDQLLFLSLSFTLSWHYGGMMMA